MKNYYAHGEWNAICQSCGRKFKSSEIQRRWDGLLVCPEDFEYRHPQDFVKAKADIMTPPWTSPRPPDVFVPINFTFNPTENITLSETVDTTADYYRYIGLDTTTQDEDVINGAQINLYAINNSNTDPAPFTNPEKVVFSEDITAFLTKNAFVTDIVTISESISDGEGEYPSDAFSLSESVIAFTITNKLINSHLINEVILG